jgi:Ca2+-binding RTX toxin-like protein
VDTETATVKGNGTYTTPTGYLPRAAGTYQWVASYGGDPRNHAVSSTRGKSSEVVVGPGLSVVGTTLYAVGGRSTIDRIRIRAAGGSDTGSTGIQVDTRLNGDFTSGTYAVTAIDIVGFGGNDRVELAPTLTVAVTVRLGDGNDRVTLGAGNNVVTLGDGNDRVRAGNGNNKVTLGNGDDQVTLGNGNNTITAGNGNDRVRLGGGTNTVTLGNGNDKVRVGDGNNMVVTGDGHDHIKAGNGDNLIVAGLGHHVVRVGDGANILIDGNVRLTQSGDTLAKVLRDWAEYGELASNVASIRARLKVTYNTADANRLTAGDGTDWFWATYADDHTDRKATDLLN